MFHAISGANGRLRTGGLLDVDCRSVDLYNTCLEALGVRRKMGNPKHRHGGVTKILA